MTITRKIQRTTKCGKSENIDCRTTKEIKNYTFCQSND